MAFGGFPTRAWANEINARDIRRNFKYYHSVAPWGIHTCRGNMRGVRVRSVPRCIRTRTAVRQSFAQNQLKSSLFLRVGVFN